MTKTNKWWFIAYPESLPYNWLDELESTGLKIFISPLHDSDIDDNKQIKKSHYHVILVTDAPTTFKHINENVVALVHGVRLKPIIGLKGAFDYLTHENNPSKAHYCRDDICYLNGACLADVHEESISSNCFEVILTLITDEKIASFRHLVHRCRELKDPYINDCLIKQCYFWRSYLYDK